MTVTICVRRILSFFALSTILFAAGCPNRGNRSGGNILRYALQTRPTQLDPARVEDGDTIDMIQQVFEGLVRWNEKNEVVPNIAEKIDLSPDGTVYTFHLKDGVKFHNGRKLTANDFVYSLTRVVSDPKSPTAMTYLDDLVGARDLNKAAAAASNSHEPLKSPTLPGIKAVDDRTLQITIDKRRPYFLAKLTYPTAYVVCREAVEANGGIVDEKAMIGTGPFKLREYQPGYAVKLVANREYHGGAPVLDGIERPILNDTMTRQNKFESGGTDYTDVQRSDIERIKKDPVLGPELKEFTRANVWYLAMNQLVFEPFKKRDVRRAFAMAINKDELIRLALHGTAMRANGILPPGVPGHDPSFQGLPYNPQEARKLLAGAGYTPKTFPRLTLSFRQGYQHIADAVLAIRNDLKQNLGIEVDTRQVEWSQFLSERHNGTMPCFHLRWAADYVDPQNFLSLMLHTGAEENKVGYSSPEFDSLCDRADVEPDPKKRADLYHQAEEVVVEDAPWVAIYFLPEVELHKPYVKGIRDSLMGHLPHVTTTVAR